MLASSKTRTERSAWPLAAILVGAVAFLLLAPTIRQDENYHSFADQRTLLGIQNFWNVLSNFPFAVVGWLGLRAKPDRASRTLFAGVFLTAFGSGYYHLAPSDQRLVWDRLPMTLVFMALVSMVISEWIGARKGEQLLGPLLLFGVASVAWWRASGDLRPYILAQFGSILVVLLAFPFSWHVRRLTPVIVLYGLAKLAEHYDQSIYVITHLSGHTWKHLLAAAATYGILRWRRTQEVS